MLLPELISGNSHIDERGVLNFNNKFDTSSIKRIYFIENISNKIIRGWQGHKVEKRWFSAVSGSFKINLIKIENWKRPNKDSIVIEFHLSSKNLDVLYVPNGYITSIQSTEKNSKLLVMADYLFGEINDEFRLSLNYFNHNP